MRRTAAWNQTLLTLLLLIVSISAHSQSSPIEIAVDAILTSSSELHTHRDIAIEWKMKGRAQAAFNDGLDNLLKDNPQLALSNFNAAIVEDNGFWEVYYYRGIAHKQLENFNDAKKDFKFLVEGNKERYYAQIELGKIALIQHDIDESDRWFNKAIKATDNNAYAHYLKANNQLTRGMDRAAANGYRDCIHKDSAFYDAWVRLAMITGKKKMSDAYPHLNQVLRRDSLNAHALLLRGLVRMSDNNTMALRDFNNLLVKDPNLLIGRYLRGIVHCELNDFDRAFSDFQRVVEATATDDNAYAGKQTWVDKRIDIQNLGTYTVSRVYGLPDKDGTALKKAYCLLVSGRAEECVKVVDALRIAETEPLCVYFKAIAMEHTGQHSKAFEFYNKALTLDKDIIDAYKKRGIYYQEMQMWDKSIADFNTVLTYQPKTLIAIRARGVSYYKSDRMAQALSNFDQYLKLDSTSEEVLSFRGMTHMRRNEVVPGTIDLVNAGRADAVDIKKLSHAVDSILFHGGDTLSVVSSLETITRKAPRLTDAYAQKLRLLVALRKWEQISGEIDRALLNRDATARASYSYLLTVKGMTRSRAKNYDEAIATLSEAIDVDKSNALAYLERGKLHAHTGKSGKAISDLNKAMSLGRKDAGPLLASVRAKD